MIALAAESQENRQSCVDVLCGYLQMPFEAASPGAKQEIGVRLTAQRLLQEHLRPSMDLGRAQNPKFWPDIAIDLSGAHLIDFGFSDCEVTRADFTGAYFQGDSWFVNSNFKSASFDKAVFTGQAAFSGVIFTDGAWFPGAEFHGTTILTSTQFGKDAFFDGASFRGPVDFGHAAFGWGAEFSNAEFAGGCKFTDVEFYGGARFTGARLVGQVDFTDARHHDGMGMYRLPVQVHLATIELAMMKEISFEGATIRALGDERQILPPGWARGPMLPGQAPWCEIVRSRRHPLRPRQR